MAGGVHGPEPFDAHACVALGGVQIGMSEHLGDVPDVGSAFEHECCNGVAEQVAAPVLVDAGGGQVVAHPAAQPVRAERSAGRREEEVVGEPVCHKASPDDLHVQAQPEERPLPDGHVASFAPLPQRTNTVPRSKSTSLSQSEMSSARRRPQE